MIMAMTSVVAPIGSSEALTETSQSFDGVVVVQRLDGDLHVTQVDLGGRTLDQAVAEESRRDGVIAVSPNYEVEALARPSDPLLQEQEHLFGAPTAPYGVDAIGAWSTTQGSNDVVVAVVDSGVRPFAEFSGRLLPGIDFYDGDYDADDPGDGGWLGCRYDPSSWHGTHVAGLIAAGADGRGVVGVAPNVRLLPVRVMGACGSGYVADILDGVMWAAGMEVPGVPLNPNPADIINLSLGSNRLCTAAEEQIYSAVTSLGILVVAAAGNESLPATFSAPANCRNTFSVGSSLTSGEKASYSNYGSGVDVYAPGGGLPSRDGQDGVLSVVDSGYQDPKGQSFERMQGTSMAAPVVSGIAALIKSAFPGAGPSEMAAAIRRSATACRGMTCPSGIANARRALDAMNSSPDAGAPVDVPAPEVVIPSTPEPDVSISQERYGGGSPAEVAEATARYAQFRNEIGGNQPIRSAVIASQTSFPDALTASVYAGFVGGVVLFTDPQRLSAATWRVIQDLGIREATLIGGPAAVDEDVETYLKSKGLQVSRLWGSDRYATAGAVASKVQAKAPFMFIASGLNFADAVAVGPVVYSNALPMVLAGPRGLNADTGSLIAEWRRLNPSGKIVILGGTAAVPSVVERQLVSLERPFTEEDGYFGGGFCENYPISWPRCPTDKIPVGIRSTDIERIGGIDRFDTAVKIAQWAQSNVFSKEASDVGFASGVHFADALAAVNLLGQQGFNGPLLLTNQCTRLPSATYKAASGFKSQRIVGGENNLCDFDAEVLRGKR